MGVVCMDMCVDASGKARINVDSFRARKMLGTLRDQL